MGVVEGEKVEAIDRRVLALAKRWVIDTHSACGDRATMVTAVEKGDDGGKQGRNENAMGQLKQRFSLLDSAAQPDS